MQRGGQPGFAAYWREWIALDTWPTGPAWFIGILLAFDCLAALVYYIAPCSVEAVGRKSLGAPVRFALMLIAISGSAYIPMVLAFGPMDWTVYGPFTFQTSRILSYLVYFAAGIQVGALRRQHSLLLPDGPLARRSRTWMTASLLFFVLLMVAVIGLSGKSSPLAIALPSISFVISCAVTTMAFLALFLRYGKRRVRVFDSIRESSYGMYLIHYAFVNWLQFALLGAGMPGVAKGLIVITGATLLSWGTVAMMRRSRCIAQVV